MTEPRRPFGSVKIKGKVRLTVFMHPDDIAVLKLESVLTRESPGEIVDRLVRTLLTESVEAVKKDRG